MATMSLDIGGAETHIVELSKKLSSMGCDITVASNGGVYVKELEKHGIKHVSVPMHNKRPGSILRSFSRLKKLIKKEKFDIVHAHARIPAYICGLLQKELKFRFVTTVHGTYEVTPLLKRISNWGDLTLAVSYDIKQYAIDSYAIPSDNITATVNGIDMERFSKKHIEGKADELELERNSFKIVHVSRMDKEVSIVAHQLIALAKPLEDAGVNGQIIIVGGGTDMENLKAEAQAVNLRMGREAVILCGARTDIDEILSVADVFVGVSRAALEAMSCEIPTVLAGAQGCGGVFCKDALKLSLNTNFCFRGEALPKEPQLLCDILSVYGMSKEERETLGAYGRSIASEYYSVERMANDAMSVYKKLSPYRYYKYGDVILSGYYGFGNMGDDSLLQSIIAELKKKDPEIKITVLSRKPKETEKIYGVKSIQRFDILKISRHMKHAKLLLNGGGSLLQNSTSTRSLIYYIHIMKMAKRRGLKLMLYASGIGPLYGEKNKERVKRVLDQADVITLREKESYDEILALGSKPKKVEVTLDPAFSIEPADPKWAEYLYEKNGLDIKTGAFAVSLRSWQAADALYEEKIAEAVNVLKEKYELLPIFISMQKEKDLAVCQRLAEVCGGRVIEGFSAAELCALLSQMRFVIGMRLHLLIYAASVGTPMVGLAYDPKIEAMLASFDIPYMVDIREFESSEIVSFASESYEKREEIREKLLETVREKRKLSEKDAEHVMSLLN